MKDTKIAEKMDERRDIVILRPDISAAEAARIMHDRQIGAVLIGEEDALQGIFTERDVLDRLVAAGRDPDTTRISDVMTARPVTIDEDTTLLEALRTMRERHMRHLPMTRKGKLTCMVSVRDLMEVVLQASVDDPNFPHEVWQGFVGCPV